MSKIATMDALAFRNRAPYQGAERRSTARDKRPAWSPLRRFVTTFWFGPPNLPSSLRMEWQFVTVRWLGIFLVIPGVILANLPIGQLELVAVVVSLAIAYNASIPFIIKRNPAIISHGYVTSVGDISLNVAMMVCLGDGFASPFALFLFVVTMAIAMRFGYRPSILAAAVFVSANVTDYLVRAIPFDDAFAFRSLFLILTAVLASSLKRQADRASAEMQRAYVELSDAHRKLLSVDEMKTTFVANVSHELRTPLTSIRSFAEMLLTYDDDPATQREFLGIILGESERLTRLIDDVLDIAKIEAGKVTWSATPLDLSHLLDKVGKTYSPLAVQQDLAFCLDVEPNLPAVDGDHDRLEQVVQNLLSNALKFTDRGGVSLSAKRSGEEIHVVVGDTGVGISPTAQGMIFEKFQQVGDTLTGKPRGTGLGLAICREIVTHHRGRIWVTSSPGVGSTFTVALPISSQSNQSVSHENA